jgi:hypothetical protein
MVPARTTSPPRRTGPTTSTISRATSRMSARLRSPPSRVKLAL